VSTVQAALRSFHGTEKIEAEISSYYLADEIKGTYRGMMIAIPPNEWCVFQNMTFTELSQTLKHLAGLVKLRTFRRHPRDPKKAQPKSIFDASSLGLAKSVLDVSSFVWTRSILDTINLALPKSVLGTASLASPKSILDTINLALPKSILDVSSFVLEAV
jgi:hypothetical protein